MYLDEKYTMYELAYRLVKDNGYEVLHINIQKDELWLEKYENKTSKVIRLIHQGFDWKNRLKTDVAQVFQKTKAMKKLLVGKTVEIYNIYVSAHTPLDSWEVLKKPMQLNERNPPKMKLYYLEGNSNNIKEELNRFQTDIGILSVENGVYQSDSEKEKKIDYYKLELVNELKRSRKNVENVFSFGKPLFTYIILAINIIMFYLLEMNGGSTDIENLVQYGAKYNPAIIDGEWWRIISSTFLHIGLLHLFMNMLALYYLGTAVERIFGSWRFVFIYFLAGIGGGLASFAFTVNISAGASGAIFGLFGALLFFGLIHKKIFLQTMGRGILIVIAINITFGFVVPQVDNSAHLGGLVAGFLASAIVHLPRNKKFYFQLLAFITYLGLVFGLAIFGLQNDLNSSSYELVKIESLIHEEKYEEAVTNATKELEISGDFDAEILFQRAYAYIELNKNDLAINDLEKSVQLNKEFPEAYFNLAMVYFEQGNQEKAEETVSKAYKFKPEDEAYIELYEEITGKPVK